MKLKNYISKLIKPFNLLNWRPIWQFEFSVKRTVEWYKKLDEDPNISFDLCTRDIKCYLKNQLNLMKKKILFIANVDWFYCSHRLNIGVEAIKDDYEVHLAAKFTGFEEKLIPLGFIIHPIEIDRGSNIIKTVKSFFQILFLNSKEFNLILFMQLLLNQLFLEVLQQSFLLKYHLLLQFLDWVTFLYLQT